MERRAEEGPPLFLTCSSQLAKAKMEGADTSSGALLGPPLALSRSHSAGSRGSPSPSPRRGNSADALLKVEKLRHQLEVQRELTAQEREKRRESEAEVIKVRAKVRMGEQQRRHRAVLTSQAPPSVVAAAGRGTFGPGRSGFAPSSASESLWRR